MIENSAPSYNDVHEEYVQRAVDEMLQHGSSSLNCVG